MDHKQLDTLGLDTLDNSIKNHGFEEVMVWLESAEIPERIIASVKLLLIHADRLEHSLFTAVELLREFPKLPDRLGVGWRKIARPWEIKQREFTGRMPK